jgi:hypothetical protein
MVFSDSFLKNMFPDTGMNGATRTITTMPNGAQVSAKTIKEAWPLTKNLLVGIMKYNVVLRMLDPTQYSPIWGKFTACNLATIHPPGLVLSCCNPPPGVGGRCLQSALRGW